MDRNYLFLKILTRGTRILVLKNDPTTGKSLKVDLKFSTLVPSIENKCKIENGQKLLILEDLDTRNTNIGFKKRSDHGKYVKSRFEVFDISAIYCQISSSSESYRNTLKRFLLTRGTRISVLKKDPTKGSTLKINLKFSTLLPSIDN